MKQEETILKNLKEQLKQVVTNKDVKIGLIGQFEEERAPFQVAIGITNVQNINVGLMDYRFTLKILVDFFIGEDKSQYFHKQTRDQIFEFIEKEYLLTRMKLSNLEEGIVGCFLDNKENYTTEESYIATMYLQLIGSWDPEPEQTEENDGD